MYRTIPQLLDDAAARDPDGVWLRTDTVRLSFGDARAWVGEVSSRLGDLGISHGDLVLITARNTPEYLVAMLAVCCLGAVAVSANPASSAAELRGLVAQVGPVAAVTDAELPPMLADTVRLFDVSSVVGDAPGIPGGGLGRAAAWSSTVRPDDPAVLIPTSGTTGRSKLVTQTHRAYTMAGEGFPYWMELTRDDVMLTSLPLFHINAVAYSVMGSLAVGAGLVLLPRFSASRFLDDARRFGATEFNAIGAMLEILMRQPPRADDADNPLRLGYTGPTPPRERQEEFEARFGLRLVCGYGLSESPYGLIWPRGSRPYGSLGTLRQHPVLGVVNEGRVVSDDGVDVPVGGVGEMLLRNPTLTPGYWGMPEETEKAIVDGWLHTGDLVVRNPDETFTFVSRKKEVIRRRGENLSPLEVEEALASHPSVLECAVVGVPSDLSEEEVKAFVVMRDGHALDAAALRAFAASRLAAFKVPRYWEQIDALPRTPTNRVAKPRLPAPHGAQEIDMNGTNARAAEETP
jgi:carnitine-CoA ligase